ncbi:MAG: alkaline phosphatase family protein [Caulobacteraceae bacterium]
MRSKPLRTSLIALTMALASQAPTLAAPAPQAASAPVSKAKAAPATRTPIRHVVVIFQENISFDHYFGTYPNAANPAGEPAFHALPGTPKVNGLTPELIAHNANKANPMRLDRVQAITCDMDHGYAAEQKAYDAGKLDKFVEHTGATGPLCDAKMVMGYYDGNTVTALWNYAQRFAISDNFFDTEYGPSTPGALNLIRGSTIGVDHDDVPGRLYKGILSSDLDPVFDGCSQATAARPEVGFKGHNVGDLLNARNVTWGWFQGGFKPSAVNPDGGVVCAASSKNASGRTIRDYSPHHQPFQYFEQTSNPKHLPPSSVAMIGKTDQANHQYDLADFWAAVDGGELPAVSFLKATAAEDGHAGNSGPIDEQRFLVKTINRLQKSRFWGSTAVIIAYDDSDGWYDHVMPPLLYPSKGPDDALNGPGQCGEPTSDATLNRCGYGPRLVLVAISPYARRNTVDHTQTDQASILKFIEDNWSLGRMPASDASLDNAAGSLDGLFDFKSKPQSAPLLLDPTTGEAQ